MDFYFGLRKRLWVPFVYRARVAVNSQRCGIDPDDCTLLKQLRRESVATTTLDHLGLPRTQAFQATARRVLAGLPGRGGLATEGDRLFVRNTHLHCLSVDPPDLARHSMDLLLFGLNERILNLVQSYLGLPVALTAAHLRWDIGNGEQVGTRFWHLDVEDLHVVRMIVYLTDVLADTGPFEYIPKRCNRHIRDWTDRALRSASHDPIFDAEMRNRVPESAWRSVLGGAGTILLADTAVLFHHGKIHNSERVAMVYTYTTRHPHYPKIVRNASLDGCLSERQRACFYVAT